VSVALRTLGPALLLLACGADPAPIARSVPGRPLAPDAGQSPIETANDAAADAASRSSAERPAVPRGPASLGVHVPRGQRMPLALSGRVTSIRPPSGQFGLDAWSQIELRTGGPEPERFALLKQPDSLVLPFAQGDRIFAEIDCRKGGWQRVCDAVVRNDRREIVLIVSASGDHRIAEGWSIERGPVATSEIRPVAEKSVRHTHGLVLSRDGRSLTITPHEWHRFELRGDSWLVQGYAVVWEGLRPPEGVDHRAFSLVRER
jgi:hypothetical protein